jgi:thioredoxin-related protein
MRFLTLAFLALFALPAAAATSELGDDGLYKSDWLQDTFKDLPEDLAEATAEGKRLLVMVEQRGCIYCKKMHEEVYPVPEIDAMLRDRFYVIQINMFGDVEVTDFDGEVTTEKELARKWGLLFTPTLLFFPESSDGTKSGAQLAVAQIPGAFSRWTTQDLFEWVLAKGYDGEEPFQKYHARRINERGGAQ